MLAERVGGGCRVLCTWQLVGLAVKEPWLAPSGAICTTGLENATLMFMSGREGALGSLQVFAN